MSSSYYGPAASSFSSKHYEDGYHIRRQTIRDDYDNHRSEPHRDGDAADDGREYDKPRPHGMQRVLGRPSALSPSYVAPKTTDGMSLSNRLEFESYKEREPRSKSRSLTPPYSGSRLSDARIGDRSSDGSGRVTSTSTSQSPPRASMCRRERSRSPEYRRSQEGRFRNKYRDRYDGPHYQPRENYDNESYDRPRTSKDESRQYRQDDLYHHADRVHTRSEVRRTRSEVRRERRYLLAARDSFDDETSDSRATRSRRHEAHDKPEPRPESKINDYHPTSRDSLSVNERHHNHHQDNAMRTSRDDSGRAHEAGERYERASFDSRYDSERYGHRHSRSGEERAAEDDGWTTVPTSRRSRRQSPSRQESSSTAPAALQPSEPSPPEVRFIPPTNLNSKYQPFMLILCGIPGSGKSTFARGLTDGKPWMYTRVNQDALGNRRACEDLCYDVLQQGKVPVVDRCNFNFQQRQHFINIARRCGVPVDCVVFEFDVELCIHRVQTRQEHETLAPHMAREVCERMLRDFFPPQAMRSAESFRAVKRIRSIEETEDIMMEYLHTGF